MVSCYKLRMEMGRSILLESVGELCSLLCHTSRVCSSISPLALISHAGHRSEAQGFALCREGDVAQKPYRLSTEPMERPSHLWLPRTERFDGLSQIEGRMGGTRPRLPEEEAEGGGDYICRSSGAARKAWL